MLKHIKPDHEYEKIDDDLYDYIITRDNSLCQMCGKVGDDIHHIVFKSDNGKNKPNNLILLCKECHTGNFGVHGIKTDVEKLLLNRAKSNGQKLKARLI